MEALQVGLDQPDGAVALSAHRESTLIRSVNRDLRQRTETLGDTDQIAFFCECQDATCYAPVWMSAATFDAIVGTESEWLLLDGHEPSTHPDRTEQLPIGRSHPVRSTAPGRAHPSRLAG